jgi:hypothetical protein
MINNHKFHFFWKNQIIGHGTAEFIANSCIKIVNSFKNFVM